MQQKPEDHTDESEMWREQFTKLLQDRQDQKADEMPQKKLPFAKKVSKPNFAVSCEKLILQAPFAIICCKKLQNIFAPVQ